jgi:PLP dependent protein
MTIAAHGRGTMPIEDSLKARYDSVRARIGEAAARGGHRGEDVVLVAVTKKASIDQIRQLLTFGHQDLGENRVHALTQHAAQVEDFLERQRELPSARRRRIPSQVRWHMIGHLQRNKVRPVLPVVRLIHSVDSLRLAEEIQGVAAARHTEPVEVLVQVNFTGEPQKHGVAPPATRHLVEQINTMFNIRVRGLMCMGPFVEDPEKTRSIFQRCREAFEEIRRGGTAGERFDILSMGMSHDFEAAIECGANVVRIGSAIFG